VEAAEAAIRKQVADPLGLGVTEAAAAIVEIVNSNMAEALRIVSVERGYDPREFALIAFGGAGPVHAAALAAELQIPEVIVPPAQGHFPPSGSLPPISNATIRAPSTPIWVHSIRRGPPRSWRRWKLRRPNGSRRLRSRRRDAQCCAPPICVIRARPTS
jgi:hypothetical protein